MQGRRPSFDIQRLERRLLFAAAPAQPCADSLGKAFDSSERKALLAEMTNLPADEYATLQKKLKVGVGAFDNALLSYMRKRSGPNFFFDPSDTASIQKFILDNDLSDGSVRTHADAVADSHLFPDQNSSGDYTIQLGANINWIAPGGSTNPEFLHSMNRQSWWIELAWTSIVSGDPKYANEIEYELASWSQQFPTMDVPASWSKSDKGGLGAGYIAARRELELGIFLASGQRAVYPGREFAVPLQADADRRFSLPGGAEVDQRLHVEQNDLAGKGIALSGDGVSRV